MPWLPRASVLIVKVACRLTFSVPVPIETPPSRNVTVPVGVPAPGATAVTVAVNVTFCPYIEGFTDETTAVVVSALITSWLMALLVSAL